MGRGNDSAMDRRARMASNADDGQVADEKIFSFLADNPDLAALRAAHPTVTDDDLRSAFATAGTLARRAGTQRFKKGATRTVVTRTHGLPDPDPSVHKGNIFRAVVGLFKPGRMLDLGAGKGNFSLSAAELGWQVTAVDARTVRWPDEAREDPETAALIRTIRWVQSDVREFPIATGEYDLICILGLLHHLEAPDQVALLKRCAGTPTLLDTRIAKASVDRVENYEGMFIREHGETREERDAVPQASWGNALSFQHTEESLTRLALDCGFIKVMQMRPPHRKDYTFFLLLPPAPHRRADLDRAGRNAYRERRRAKKAQFAG